MTPLSTKEIQKKLSELEEWDYENNAIHTSIEFKDFKDTFSVMTRIAFEAEKLQHHPDWTNNYNMLHISLSTHDVGGVTSQDFELAKIIDSLID